ncbi:peptidase inhibitor I9 [Cytobacillus firmus]|uniref:Peptidase inhibitor I9 n=2 Tax=Cytobacillus TaxID=2675230 RepID=A0A366JLJ4_CYTFI|nr:MULTISPECIES: S8 family serine peptidase [Cytobacillus]RBP87602.1 peptidase inhibitor I9 [Cytobacillus firmus]TDX39428.1 peptidase inhibitor I9 [Cytobacillus oceanisediminis]
MGKEVSSKLSKGLSTFALAGALVMSWLPLAQPHSVVAKTESVVTYKEVLNNITPEQRRVIKVITSASADVGIQLPSTIDLSSDKEISVIVEFKGNAPMTNVLLEELKGNKLSINDAKAQVEKEHKNFKEDLKKLKVKGKITSSFQESYNGVSMSLPASQVSKLAESKHVKNIWENQKVELIQPVSNEAEQSSIYIGKHPHEMSQVDKLYEKGLTGKGVKVAVLDSGIDYNHPDLMDAYKGGYDFVDEDNDPMEATYEEWKESGQPLYNPTLYYTSHGTHVSGILAGQGDGKSPLSVKGVAPDADLYVYRVLGPYGSGTIEDVLQGIEQSLKDKMDVINLSLGDVLNDPLSPLSASINNAALAGVTPVLAAGNEGPGLYSVGSPATSALGITVGSTDTKVSYPNFTGTLQSSQLQGNIELRYSTSELGVNPRDLKGKTLPIVDVGQGTETEYEGKDVRGKIVLIQTGGTERLNVAFSIAKEKGAAVAIGYSKYGGFISDSFPEDPHLLPAFTMEGSLAKELSNALKTEEVTVTFDEIKEREIERDDYISFFSSSGPARLTYDIKPEVVAPGGNILSTVPKYYYQVDDYKQSYAKFSGTSMAAPHVAGIAALLLQANPKSAPDDIKGMLMNTADDLEPNYSVFDLGAGKVDALEAAEASLLIQVKDTAPHMKNGKVKTVKDLTGALSFGTKFVTGSDIVDSREISLQNRSDQDQEYSVDISFNVNARGSLDGQKQGVELKTAETVALKANGKKEISVNLLIPEAAEIGIYEGYVTFTNVNQEGEVYQLPFAVRKVKEGVDYVESSNFLSTVRENGYSSSPSLNGSFSLNSHMKNIDIFLVDTETNKEIGFLGSMDGRFIQENTHVNLYGYFNGSYYPLTNDPRQPIAYETKEAIQGTFKTKFVFTADDGKQTIIEKPFVLDNEMPTLHTELKERIIEVDSDASFSIPGAIQDPQIDLAKGAGIEVNQGNNRVTYLASDRGYDQYATVNEAGNFQINGYLPSYRKVVSYTVKGMDRAGVNSLQKEYFYVRKGTPYLATVPDKEEVKTGENIHYSVSAHNHVAWKQLTNTYTFNKTNLSIDTVEVVDELKDKVILETAETPQGMSVTLTSKTGEAIDASESGILLNIEVNLKNNTFYSSYLPLTSSGIKLTKTDNTTIALEGISPSVKVWSSLSELTSEMNGEAVFLRDKYGKLLTTDIDYKQLGAVIKAVDQAGNEYQGEVINDGKFKILLPSTQENMTLIFEAPGHFKVVKEFQIGREAGYGEQQFIQFFPAVAGDANNDQIVDIKDAVYLEEHWRTADRQADFNFDGKVDMEDMKYIQNNFLKVNPMVKVKDKPKEKLAGRNLEDIVNGLK